MQKTTCAIPKMDCTAGEQMIRTALAAARIVVNIVAGLTARELTVVHTGVADANTSALTPLNLAARSIATDEDRSWTSCRDRRPPKRRER